MTIWYNIGVKATVFDFMLNGEVIRPGRWIQLRNGSVVQFERIIHDEMNRYAWALVTNGKETRAVPLKHVIKGIRKRSQIGNKRNSRSAT